MHREALKGSGLKGSGLTLVLIIFFFIHLKLELLTQFPPSNQDFFIYL